MANNKHTIVENIALSRKNLIELILVAILLAFGTNLVAGQLVASSIFSPLARVLLGAILCLGSALYLATRLLIKRVERRPYQAFLIYEQKKNKIIEVPRYTFSEKVCHYMEYASAENPVLNTLWEKEPLEGLRHSNNKSPKSAQLLSELTEYIVLDMLSTHLTDYFNRKELNKKNLKEYGREDIPEVLLKNRYLELFSRPPEDRPIFSSTSEKDNSVDKLTGMKIVGIYKDKAMYAKFDLVLPKKSTIRRQNANKIEIETPKLKMSITVRFEGFNTILPDRFEQYYLGLNDSDDMTAYQLNVEIQVAMKLRALLSNIGWEYYRWVDSFLDEIENEISQEAFFNRLNWEATLTILKYLNRSQTKVRRIKR